MKKVIFSILICYLLLLVGCKKDDGIIDSYPLFWVELNIYLSEFSDDISVKLNKGYIHKVELNEEGTYVKINFSDPESTHPKEISSKEYILTLTSETAFPDYPSGYKVKLKTDNRWAEVSEIYNNEGEEISFTALETSGHIKIEIDNTK
ncbi:MAG: hypothetical protein E6767_13025 [Dysgonomonas sp.]|nr:hypothetical protein [Dysgonomonas sp.]